jgi:hypothetical protein
VIETGGFLQEAGQHLGSEFDVFDAGTRSSSNPQSVERVEDLSGIARGSPFEEDIFCNTRESKAVGGIVFGAKRKPKDDNQGLCSRHRFGYDADTVRKGMNFWRQADLKGKEEEKVIIGWKRIRSGTDQAAESITCRSGDRSDYGAETVVKQGDYSGCGEKDQPTEQLRSPLQTASSFCQTTARLALSDWNGAVGLQVKAKP